MEKSFLSFVFYVVSCKKKDDSEAQVAVEERVEKKKRFFLKKKNKISLFTKVRGMLTKDGKNADKQPKQAAIRLVEIGPRIEVKSGEVFFFLKIQSR